MRIFWNLQLFPSGFKISTSTRIHIQIEFARPHVFCVFTNVASSMRIYWNKRKRLHKKRVQLPQDWFATQTWPPFHCFGTQIWPPLRHVKTQPVFKLNLPVHTYPDSLLTSTPGNVGNKACVVKDAKFASCSALREPGNEVQYSQ